MLPRPFGLNNANSEQEVEPPSLGQDRERVGLGGSESAQVAGVEPGFHVFGYLLGRLEIHLVNSVLVELAIVGRVVSADLGTGFVNAAAVIRLQMFAIGVNQQVPRFVLDEDRGAVVQQIPTDEIQILLRGGGIDRHRKVAAALRCAVGAQDFARRHILALRFAAIDRFGGQKLQRCKGCGTHRMEVFKELSWKSAPCIALAIVGET